MKISIPQGATRGHGDSCPQTGALCSPRALHLHVMRAPTVLIPGRSAHIMYSELTPILAEMDTESLLIFISLWMDIFVLHTKNQMVVSPDACPYLQMYHKCSCGWGSLQTPIYKLTALPRPPSWTLPPLPRPRGAAGQGSRPRRRRSTDGDRRRPVSERWHSTV